MGVSMTSNNAANFGFGVATRVLTSNGPGVAPSFLAPATGTPPSLGYKAGYYYQLNYGGTVGTSAVAVAADTMHIFPFYVSKSQSFDSLTFNVSTGGANGTARLGIYNIDGFATTVLADLGTVVTSANGVVTLGITQTLSPGWYGFALQHGSSTGNGSSYSGVSTTISKMAFLPIGTVHGTTSIGALQYAAVYASGLPDCTALTPTLLTTQILIALRAS
jgi:hypothetical protein